jgi:hypothetical protein
MHREIHKRCEREGKKVIKEKIKQAERKRGKERRKQEVIFTIKKPDFFTLPVSAICCCSLSAGIALFFPPARCCSSLQCLGSME